MESQTPTITVGHEVVVFLPEVDGKPPLVLLLYVGDVGDMEHHLAELVLEVKN